jgi:hypothetical protein
MPPDLKRGDLVKIINSGNEHPMWKNQLGTITEVKEEVVKVQIGHWKIEIHPSCVSKQITGVCK